MTGYRLFEYRPNRWARVDVETGSVVGLATPREVRAWKRRFEASPAKTPPAEQAGTDAAASIQASDGPAPVAPEVAAPVTKEEAASPGVQQPTASPAEAQTPTQEEGAAPPGAQQPATPAKKSRPGKSKEKGRMSPLKKRYLITSNFQAHRNRTPPSKAPGIDLACPPGTDVRAWAEGKVVRSRWSQGGGRSLWLDHGRGLQTYYAHLSCVHVLEGETAKAGQKIGESGNSGNTTGPHLHFSVIKKRQYVDPEEFLDLK